MEPYKTKDSFGRNKDIASIHSLEKSISSGSSTASRIILVNENHLVRDCIESVLAQAGAQVLSYLSVSEWIEATERPGGEPSSDDLILLCIGPSRVGDEAVVEAVEAITERADGNSLIIMGDLDTLQQIAGAIRLGAKGYLSMRTPLPVALGALNLVRAGGVYVPVSTFLPSMEQDEAEDETEAAAGAGCRVFTSRQMAVVSALRQGKPNKLIAYELNMSESTVKVHVRNIMRRLGARNRTEVAFRTNELFAEETTGRLRSGKP